MANTVYENFVLENEVEDQFNSLLDLNQFCIQDNTLEGVPGMIKKVNVYSATNGTQKLAMGEGNDTAIEVGFTSKSYTILLAQNRFAYYDEQAMKDPMIVPVGVAHAAVDMYNTVNADVYAEFKKAITANQIVLSGTNYFNAFVDASAALSAASTTRRAKERAEAINQGAPETFAFVSPADLAAIRKALGLQLQYVEAFAREGYVGTVAGINLYVKKDATAGLIVGGTREAVTVFTKKGTEVEQFSIGNRSEGMANIRQNWVYTRKYYLAAATNTTQLFKIATSF